MSSRIPNALACRCRSPRTDAAELARSACGAHRSRPAGQTYWLLGDIQMGIRHCPTGIRIAPLYSPRWAAGRAAKSSDKRLAVSYTFSLCAALPTLGRANVSTSVWQCPTRFHFAPLSGTAIKPTGKPRLFWNYFQNSLSRKTRSGQRETTTDSAKDRYGSNGGSSCLFSFAGMVHPGAVGQTSNFNFTTSYLEISCVQIEVWPTLGQSSLTWPNLSLRNCYPLHPDSEP